MDDSNKLINLKIKVIGINDKRIFIAINKLIKAFNRQNVIVTSDYDYLIHVSSLIKEKKIKVILTCGSEIIKDETEIFEDVLSDKKYLILACIYRLFVKISKKELSYGVLTGIRPTKLVHRYKEKYSDDIVLSILQKKYLITKEKAELLLLIANYQKQLVDFPKLKDEVSIYINVPFCLSKCSYCSFTSYPIDLKELIPKQYLTVLLDEIKIMGAYLKEKHIPITTIYVGGGTPSALNYDHLKSLLYHIETYLINDSVLEFTLECGRPDSLTLDKLKLIKEFSVTRISINPQTFNRDTLKQMNRRHSIDDIIKIYQGARDIGFDNINMDLIIGLPNETIEDYKHSIDETIGLAPDSITVHYLAQKRGSKLFNEQIEMKRSDYFTLFSYAYKQLIEHHYSPYYLYRQKNIVGNLENTGYCQKEKVCLYNILMIEEAQNIIGLGCGASSKFLNHDIVLNPKDIKSYITSYQKYIDKKINNMNENIK